MLRGRQRRGKETGDGSGQWAVRAGARHAPLLGLLQPAAAVAEELVPLAEHLARAELAEARGDGRVLLDVDREVEEGLVARGDLRAGGGGAGDSAVSEWVSG